ncbi:MAG: TIGR03960 family B12-binding radical SAM protein [Candidatus Omnitrophica bacterium]|nr:TIGR03960 family B12-binding radical SAM protein [Candidatus Omnitrophota bacterium]
MTSLTELLKNVFKPGRYIGEETNISKKKFTQDKLNIVLGYPDIYEVGMSYLGFKILYHLLNEHEDIICERVFSPWPDMELELRKNNKKLFSLESKIDINKFDILGVSLSYELTYSNVLNLLDLSGIPVLSADRGEESPIVMAGGATSYNPEPMSMFIDVFFFGDAEEALPVLCEKILEFKNKKYSRKQKLEAISQLTGVYVPSMYIPQYDKNIFVGLKKINDKAPDKIFKNTISSLEKAYYPTKQIVSLIRTVHDRMSLEIMRGCPHACRFCQASSTSGPVRLRSVEKLVELAEKTYRSTGYSQISLLSLSSANYPHLKELIQSINRALGRFGVGLSIPSLRVTEAFYDMPELLSVVKKAGLTFAPETADIETQKNIGKYTDIEVLCKSARQAYKSGWTNIKLYFMVGLGGNIENETEGIWDWANKISMEKRSFSKKPGEIKLSINPFIPKPHTPFQWKGMADYQSICDVKKKLVARSSRRIYVEFNDIDKAVLEAALSRGERSVGNAIYTAWQRGAKMDSSSEYFNFAIWKKAFEDNGKDIFAQAVKSYSIDSILPWSHVNVNLNIDALKEEYLKS